jgi:NADPH-dependent 2,4-dienoyl-CoA reductase/sulfur reductase-like enzyme
MHNGTRSARGGVLVLGGGFAGGYVARQLGPSGATVVNPTNFMLYTPLLPEAAAGSVEPRHVAVPLRTISPHAELVLGSAVSLDARRRIVEVDSEAGRLRLAYRELVIALGATTRVPDVPGLREHAFALKDLPDAIRLRNHVLRQIELADAVPEQAARRLTFVFAGAGFAGVEVIAELHELVADALRHHPRLAGVAPRLDPARRGRSDPAPDARAARRRRPPDATRARHRDPHRDLARLRRAGQRRLLQRAAGRVRDRRVDRRRDAEPAPARPRSPAGRARPRARG